jgi:ABC-type phosphate transport system substrate-binding protein
MRTLVAIGFALAVLAMGAPTRAVEEPAFVLIVNPDLKVEAVDRAFVAKAYLKKSDEWPDGKVVLPIDLDEHFPARAVFTREVLHKTKSQLRSYWDQQIFSGKGTPPPEASSTAAIVKYVLSHPGAIGYIPAGDSPGGARIVPIR